jgi:hypothetical protein
MKPLIASGKSVKWNRMITIFGLAGAFSVPALIGMWRHSFWLDETFTLFPLFSGHRSFFELVTNLQRTPGSIAYTPLHTLLAAAWASVSPSSEFGLRLMNLPMLLGSAWLAWIWARFCEPTSALRRWTLAILFATSPFFIYYGYDFRPYALLILTGAMMAVGLLLLNDAPPKGLWLICGGTALAFVTQPTVALVVPVLGGVILWQHRRAVPQLARQAILPVLVCAAPAALVGWYYVQVWKRGGMASFGAPPTIKNLLFVFYEFLGLLGIGPTREGLRALAPPPGRDPSILVDLRPSNVDWIEAGAGVLLLMIAFLIIIQETRRASHSSRFSSLQRVALFGFGGIVVLALFFRLKEHRYLARHLSFLFAPVCWPLLTLLVNATARHIRNWFGVAGVLALQLWSSANLLFNPAYGRDDFRGGFAAAREKLVAKEASAIFFIGGFEAPLLYGGQKEVGFVKKDQLVATTRIGTGRHSLTDAKTVRELYDRGISLWCLGDQTADQQKDILELYAGRTVVIVASRGTEGDNRGLIWQLVKGSPSPPRGLGRFPFVEAILVSIPSRQGG